MEIANCPLSYDMYWDVEDAELPSINIVFHNQSDKPAKIEVCWDYDGYEGEPIQINDEWVFVEPMGGEITWAEEDLEEVAPNQSKSFFAYGDELKEMVAASQIASPDMHRLSVRFNGELHTFMQGDEFAIWLEKNLPSEVLGLGD